jgi:hypothetical protein
VERTTFAAIVAENCWRFGYFKPRKAKKCGVSNSGLAATSNPVSQVLW